MKNVKLKLNEKKLSPSPTASPNPSPSGKQPAAKKSALAPAALEMQDLRHDEDLARLLESSARREIRALLATYPALIDDPEIRALEAAIQDEISNRITPGLHNINNRLVQQRARIVELRSKMKAVEQEAEIVKGDGDLPIPGQLPKAPFHLAGEHPSEYAVLAKEAHRATKRRGGRGLNKVAGETTDSHSDESTESTEDTSDEAPTDTHNDGQSLTGFH